MRCVRCRSRMFYDSRPAVLEYTCLPCGNVHYTGQLITITEAKVDVLQKEAIHIGGKERLQ